MSLRAIHLLSWPVFWGFAALSAPADVVVLHNGCPYEVAFASPAKVGEVPRRLPSGRHVALPCLGPVDVLLTVDGGPVKYSLVPNCVYRFVETIGDRTELKRLDLRGDDRSATGTGILTPETLGSVATLKVKILVDEEQPAAAAAWQRRFSERIAASSRVLEVHCRVRLAVVEFGAWRSDNTASSYHDLYADFHQQVDPQPARLAIGFSSQFDPLDGLAKAGDRPRPLTEHLLIGERSSKLSEAERLEVLLHQLGHFLGAADSDDPRSVMRTALGDGKARRVDFPIGFDPVNTLTMNLFADEIRGRNTRRLADLSPATMLRLRQVYGVPERSPPPESTAGPSQNIAKGNSTSEPPVGNPLSDASPPPAREDHVRADRVRLQGTWISESAERDGKPYEYLVGLRHRFQNDHVTVNTKSNGTLRFQFKLYPAVRDEETGRLAEHKRVDLMLNFNGQTYRSRGIYKFDGNDLHICHAFPGKPRPTKFAAEKGDDQAVLIFRRANGQR